MKGRKFSEEHKNRISKSNTGKITSEETRKKQSLARMGKIAPTKGTKLSVERREFIRQLNTGRISAQRVKIIIDNQTHESFTNASKILNISLHTIRNRCLNKNFPNYNILKEK